MKIIILMMAVLSAPAYAGYYDDLIGGSKADVLVCQYTEIATPEGLKPQNNFSLTFIITKDKAYMASDKGLVEVQIVYGQYTLTFIETTPEGIVEVTAVNRSDEKSVHSRNTVMPTKDTRDVELFPSQSYGKCHRKE